MDKHEIGTKIVGALAYDIRGTWRENVKDRYYAMDDILEQLGVTLEEACDDGRYFRDNWAGPYSPANITEDEMKLFGYDLDIFECYDSYHDY